MSELTGSPAWTALSAHAAALAGTSMRDLFAADPGRAERMTFRAAGLVADLSKHKATGETLARLLDLAHVTDVAGCITTTENASVESKRSVISTRVEPLVAG